MKKSIAGRGLFVCGALVSAFAVAAPAVAGRSTQVDQPYEYVACQFGQSCGGFDLQYKFGYESDRAPFHRAYLYAQGVISFDAEIPVGADPNDPGTWGDNWFAPGFSMDANYTVGYGPSFHGYDFADDQLFAFYTPGAHVHAVDDPDPFDDVDEFIPADFPLMTATLFSNGDFFEESGLFSGYEVDPLPGAIIGFRTFGGSQWVKNQQGLLVGSAAADTDFITTFGRTVPRIDYSGAFDDDGNQLFDENGNPLFYDLDGNLTTRDGEGGYVTGPSSFTPRYANGAPDPLPVTDVPEPATWAMMLAGFGFVGSALRRRRGQRPAVA